MNERGMMSWSIGSCRSESKYKSNHTYTRTCCLHDGRHIVQCTSYNPPGWHGGYITIDEQNFCKEFENGSVHSVIIQVLASTVMRGIVLRYNPVTTKLLGRTTRFNYYYEAFLGSRGSGC